MQAVMDSLLQDRAQAGKLLSNKLSNYKNGNAVVVGIPHGGVCVAYSVAEALSLPMEILPCRGIKHPADHKKVIGSVSVNEVLIHDVPQNIPQDYIYHQIELIRSALRYEHHQYYGSSYPSSFLYKTVIVVDDVLHSSDSILACVRGIRKQRPLKIVVAVPVVAAEAARTVQAEVDEFIFLQMESVINSGKDYYENFPNVDARQVKELLEQSRKTVGLYE